MTPAAKDDMVVVTDLDVTFNSGQVYACTIKPGDVLDETPEAITIRFRPRTLKDAKGVEVERAGEVVEISRSQVAMVSKRERQMKIPTQERPRKP